MESEADDDIRGASAARLRTILAILVSVVVPAWLLVAALRASPEPLVPLLFVAFSVTLVRGAAVVARWVALGPGRRSDRVIWSLFVVAMLTLAPFATFRSRDAFGVALLVLYFGMQTIYWRFARFIGERENTVDRDVDARLSLQDALVALALFCIVVASIRMCIDWTDFRVRKEETIAFLLASSVLPAAGMIPFFCDLAMRAAIRSRSSRDRRIGTAIVTIPTVISIVSLLVVSVVSSRSEFVLSTFGFIVAYVVYAAFQETVLAVAGIAAVDPSTEAPPASRSSRSSPR